MSVFSGDVTKELVKLNLTGLNVEETTTLFSNWYGDPSVDNLNKLLVVMEEFNFVIVRPNPFTLALNDCVWEERDNCSNAHSLAEVLLRNVPSETVLNYIEGLCPNWREEGEEDVIIMFFNLSVLLDCVLGKPDITTGVKDTVFTWLYGVLLPHVYPVQKLLSDIWETEEEAISSHPCGYFSETLFYFGGATFKVERDDDANVRVILND